MRIAAVSLSVLLVAGGATPAGATEPGTPMDCSDLELAPGLTCTTLVEPGAGGLGVLSQSVLTNDGEILAVGIGSIADNIEPIGSCGSNSLVKAGLLFALPIGGARIPLVTVDWRCLDAAASRVEYARFLAVLFDPVRGRLLVGAYSNCGGPGGVCPGYGGGGWVARIDGFTPLAEVLPPPTPLCNNGLDDDGDGRIDAADSNCKSAADNDESRP